MRKMMLVVGAGLLAIAALPNAGMAAETVVKKNFNLPKLVLPTQEPPEPLKGTHEHTEELGSSEVLVPPDETIDLPPANYGLKIVFPYAHEEGHDHDGSITRNAGKEQRRSPRR